MAASTRASTRARRRQEFHPLTVAAVARLCDDAVAVTFHVPPELADAYAFRAGQSLTLRTAIAGRDERRSYSICAPEGAAPRIGIRAIPGGLLSTRLVRQVRPGDKIEVGTPTGSFTPDVETAGHHVLIAAGSGITPVLSIAATVLRNPQTTATLLYGNRRASTVMFAEELADLKDRYPARLGLLHVLSREPQATDLLTGRLDAGKLNALLALLPAIQHVDHWWLCGPFGMVTGAQTLLEKAGVPAGRIHRELFHVDDLPAAPFRHEETALDGVASNVTIVLDGRATTARVPRDVSVLDGAQRSRPDLPFACKSGVCGTCRAKVTEGEIDMRRNFALEQCELDAGIVLTCQAIPRSEKVTVDFDVCQWLGSG